MTVRELIETLETYNPDYTVIVETIVNNVNIDHVRCGILFSDTHGVVIYPKEK